MEIDVTSLLSKASRTIGKVTLFGRARPGGAGSPLYQRLIALRLAVPLIAFALVLSHQVAEHTLLRSLGVFQHFLSQMLFYGIIGPTLAWATLHWITYRVRERDEAEAHLAALYEVSRQVTATAEVDALVQLALRAPEHVLQGAPISIVARERRDSPWVLAGTSGLSPVQVDRLQGFLARGGHSLQCDGCSVDQTKTRRACPLLAAAGVAREGSGPEEAGATCFPLSTDRPPNAVLTIHSTPGAEISTPERQALESMMAGLAPALDRARLRAQSLEAIQLINAGVGHDGALGTAVNQILGDLAAAHQADAGAVYLAAAGTEPRELVAIAGWPTEDSPVDLLGPAQRALDLPHMPISHEESEMGPIVALPLAMGELSLGVLVLRRSSPFTELHTQLLHIATSVLAAVVRNSQLNLQLEGQSVLAERSRIARELHDGLAQTLGFMNFKIQQIDRSLGRNQTDAAQRQLRELLGEVQQLYADARLSVVDLRWNAEKRDLRESLGHAVEVFESRSRLAATFSCEGVPTLPAREEAQLLAVVHEALSNVQKHADASQVWVRLRSLPAGFTIEVEDDGRGIDEHPQPESGHFGMHIMQERATEMGGSATWSAGARGGTLFRLSIPATVQAMSGAES